MYWNGLRDFLETVQFIRVEQLFTASDQAVAPLQIKTKKNEYLLAEHLAVQDRKITKIDGYRGPGL